MTKAEQNSQHLDFDTMPNAEWHSKHRLPDNPTLDQRVKWHMEHARRCACPAHDEDIVPELRERYSGKHQEFWIEHNTNDHRMLGLWAAECAERLLPYFEENYGADTRPRYAIRTLRAWVKTGEFHMSVIRAAALHAHAAAKLVDEKDKAANFSAHAAGQAVGTAHVPTHAIGTILYSIRLIATTHPTNVKNAMAKEREWQTQRLPENLQPWVDAWVERTIPLLPKDLRAQSG